MVCDRKITRLYLKKKNVKKIIMGLRTFLFSQLMDKYNVMPLWNEDIMLVWNLNLKEYNLIKFADKYCRKQKTQLFLFIDNFFFRKFCSIFFFANVFYTHLKIISYIMVWIPRFTPL